MNKKPLFIALIISTGMFFTGNAFSSYMSNCDKLIGNWKTCRASSQSCAAETKIIEKECKCHTLKQGEWKLVTAAVGKNGVCAPEWPESPPPQPSDPSPPPYNKENYISNGEDPPVEKRGDDNHHR